MATRTPHKPYKPHKPQPTHDVDIDDPEPGMLPVEPDDGVTPPMIPEDPEHDRILDPEA